MAHRRGRMPGGALPRAVGGRKDAPPKAIRDVRDAINASPRSLPPFPRKADFFNTENGAAANAATDGANGEKTYFVENERLIVRCASKHRPRRPKTKALVAQKQAVPAPKHPMEMKIHGHSRPKGPKTPPQQALRTAISSANRCHYFLENWPRPAIFNCQFSIAAAPEGTNPRKQSTPRKKSPSKR